MSANEVNYGEGVAPGEPLKWEHVATDSTAVAVFVEADPETVSKEIAMCYKRIISPTGLRCEIVHELLRKRYGTDSEIITELDRQQQAYHRVRRLAGLAFISHLIDR